jgi:protein O-mannosyl-transferase
MLRSLDSFTLRIAFVLGLLLAALYSLSLQSAFIFDDASVRLAGFQDTYRNPFVLRTRALSYATFVWVEDVFGARHAIWQRVVNVLLHLGVCVSLVAFYRRFTAHFELPMNDKSTPSVSLRSHSLALLIAVAYFAFNPMATYATAYLVQRSMLMCTLFGVLALICVLKAAQREGRHYWLFAGILYLCAFFSKEYVVMLPLAAAAVYIVVRRPPAHAIAVAATIFAAIGSTAGYFLWQRFGAVIGTPFDELSVAFVRQLQTQSPNIKAEVWPLSILNQMVFFFEYGWLWFFPNVNAMSIDMRPPFPLQLTEAKYVVAAIAYVVVALCAVLMLLRYRDWRSLVGWCMVFVASLFSTEFALVWIQDSFVLYRSYLWAVAIPGLVYLVAVRWTQRTQLAVLGVVCVFFCVLSYDRIVSMRTPYSVWDDAVAKLPESVTVGQSRSFFNRGEARYVAGDVRGAIRDFQYSTRLGDGGEGLLNIATILADSGRPAEAMQALVGATRRGMDRSVLYFNAGTLLLKVGALEEAYEALSEAFKRGLPAEFESEARAKRALAAIDLKRLDIAREDVRIAVERSPNNLSVLQAQAFEALARGDQATARDAFDRLIKQSPAAINFYGRARGRFVAGDREGAIADLAEAMRLDPGNAVFAEMHRRVSSQLSGKSDATSEKTRGANPAVNGSAIK